MKQYVIDQLREQDYYDILDYLNENADKTMVEEVFWVNLPEELYSDLQHSHTDCHPFYFAVNLNRNRVSFEWLIRSRQSLRCNCIAYATPEQRDYIIDWADKILAELKIRL